MPAVQPPILTWTFSAMLWCALAAPCVIHAQTNVPWSYAPLRRVDPPQSPFDGRSAGSIDRFLFARLAEQGLTPSPPASRLALLRRATVDLTGLLPTPAEIDAFLGDPSPLAFEKVVDRLLASPAYGERWARHWLDVVRFGESHGYEQNHLRAGAWPYRDYVIRSINEDKPFSRFVAEQLAGDVLGKGAPDVEVATGFLVAGVHDTVGNSTLEAQLQQRANDLDDMVSTVGAAFLGLTVGCAKCHDHKFDPIPQRDYYRLAAVFAGVRHAERSLAPAVQKQESDDLARQVRLLQGMITDLDARARNAVLKTHKPPHPALSPRGRGWGEGGAVQRPAINTRRNVEDFAPTMARFVRFTVLATRENSEPCIDEIEIYSPNSIANLALSMRGSRARASSLLPGYAIHQVSHLNDGKYGNEHSWISNERGRGWAEIELAQPSIVSRLVWSRDATDPPRYQDRLPSAYRIEISLDGKDWRSVATGADRAAALEAIPLATLLKSMTDAQRRQRTEWLAQLEQLRNKLGQFAPRTAYIGQFSAPDAVHVLRRGDVLQKRELVAPGALSEVRLNAATEQELKIDPTLGEAGRRLALANWLTDPGNPLTARVIVNRVWQHHFGRGLVATPSDFGNNGSLPSHPDLLDWLAADFQEQGWHLKRLHKQIMLSYAYRQSSAVNDKAQAADAENVFLWRMPLRRLEAEALRDAILQVSGKLDRSLGGPGFRLFKYKVVNVAIYEPLTEHGPETWRRSIYAVSARAIRDDLMGNFDVPECSQRNPRRDITTTPLQALSLLNGSFATQQASFFADRITRDAGADVESQVTLAFRLALGRTPNAQESSDAAAFVRTHGLSALCRAMLSANEFAYY